MEWIWIGVIISLVLIELISLNLTAIWFVISSIVSFILLKFGQNYIIQVIVFLVGGLLLVLLFRHRVMDKYIAFRDKQINKILLKHPFLYKMIPDNIETIKIKHNNDNQKKKHIKK